MPASKLDTFTLINAYFDDFVTRLARYDAGKKYVFRVLVDGWVSGLPATAFFENAQVFASSLAAGNALSTYEIVSVCMQKPAQSEEVKYYDAGPLTLPYGAGYNASVLATDSTWIVDVVFIPRITHVAHYSTLRHACDSIALRLTGQPSPSAVWPVGVIELTSGTGVGAEDVQSVYEAAAAFWAGKQSYWVVTQKTDSGLTGFNAAFARAHQPPSGAAWDAFPPYLGQDKAGLVEGDALFPQAVKPIATAQPSGTDPGTGQPSVVQPPAPDGGKKEPPGLTTGEKALGAVAGLVGGYLLGKKLLQAWRAY